MVFEPAAVRRVLPFVIYIAFIFIADMAGRLGFSPGELRWLYAFKISAVLLVLLCYRRHYSELLGARLSWRQATEAIVAGVVVWLLWISLTAGWMQIGSSAGFDPRTDGALDWPLIAVRIFGAALVVPVMEELFWRSFLMRWLARADFLQQDPARVGIKALAISVVLFGVEHTLWLAGIVAGLVYSFLYMRSKNLWVPTLAHGVTNGLLGVWVVATGQWSFW